MSFCTSLRRRPSCSNLLPACQGLPLSLRENDHQTHDIAIKTRCAASTGQAKEHEQEIRFVIATPSAIATTVSRDAIVLRVQRHTSLAGGRYCAVIFHLTPARDQSDGDTVTDFPPPLHAFNTFQILLVQARINIPLLPLSNPSALASIIAAFARPFTSRSQAQPVMPISAALHVLPYCTTEGPMQRETVVALTDQTTCLRDVAGLGEQDAQRLIEGGVSGKDFEGILGFWAEEWVVE